MPTVFVIDGPNFCGALDFVPISYPALMELMCRISLEITGDEKPKVYWVDRESPPCPHPSAVRAMEKAGIIPYLVHTPRVGLPGQTVPKDVDTAIAACAFGAVLELFFRSSAPIENIHCIIVSGDYDMIHIMDELARNGFQAYVVQPPGTERYCPSTELRKYGPGLTAADMERIMLGSASGCGQAPRRS